MGKQINYYMGYQDFLSVSQAALLTGMLTKVYNKPERVVKKTAPYTEYEHFVVNLNY